MDFESVGIRLIREDFRVKGEEVSERKRIRDAAAVRVLDFNGIEVIRAVAWNGDSHHVQARVEVRQQTGGVVELRIAGRRNLIFADESIVERNIYRLTERVAVARADHDFISSRRRRVDEIIEGGTLPDEADIVAAGINDAAAGMEASVNFAGNGESGGRTGRRSVADVEVAEFFGFVEIGKVVGDAVRAVLRIEKFRLQA